MNFTGDLDTQPGQDAQFIIAETCKWTEKFYDWDQEELEEYLTINSSSRIVYIEYQYQQLGKDEEWFKKTCQTLLNDPLKIKREIFLQRMRGSSQSPFAPEDLALIEELKGSIKEEIFINKLFKFDVYEELKRDRVYLVGVDVSNGYGEDNSAVVVVDPYTLRTVAEFQSPFIGVTQLWKFLYTLVRKYLPRSILCIERNANGESVISSLRETEIANNIYYDSNKDFVGSQIDDKLDPKGFLKREAARRKLYGIWTEGKSRDIMIGLLERHVAEHKDKFITENVITDILRLVKNARGKILAASGFHDDSIMAYLMCLYVYYHGNNLHRFGYIRGEIPDEEKRNKGLTYEEVYEELPEETKKVFQDFSVKDQSDYYAKMALEMQMAQKHNQYIDTLINPINYAENYNEFGDDGEINLDFFDELNE